MGTLLMKIDKYDRTVSDVIREAADWACEICFIQSRPESMTFKKMECSHDRSRRHVLTRYDPRNLICSCSGCHRKTTEDHYYHEKEFTRIKGGEVRQLMREMSLPGGRLKSWERDEIRKHYQEELKRIKEMRMNGVQGKIELEIPEVLK